MPRVRPGWPCLLLILISFLVYWHTLYPGLPGGDSGELITIAYTLGVAHPPGYPLYTLLGKLFTWIPFGTIAWRMNLFSAFSNALASGILCILVNRWIQQEPSGRETRSRFVSLSPGLLSGGLFAFSPLVWRYSTQAEVFAFNHLLICIFLWIILKYWETRDFRYVLGSTFGMGLALSHHHTSILITLPFTLWVLNSERPRLKSARPLLQLLISFGMGILPYLYLPWAGKKPTLSSWGDPSTWSGFLDHFFRREYGTFQLTNHTQKSADFVQNLIFYFQDIPQQTLYIGGIFALWGLRKGLQKVGLRGFMRVSLFAYSFYILIFNSLANLNLDHPLYLEIQSRFWQLPNLFIFLWIGIGFHFCLIKQSRPWMTYGLVATAFGALISSILVNFPDEDEHRNVLFTQFGRSVIEFLPPHSLVLTRGDTFTNAVRYLQECEGLRKDIRIIDRELLKTPWMKRIIEYNTPDIVLPGRVYRSEYTDYRLKREKGEYGLRDLFDSNYPQRPIFITSFDPRDDRQWEKEYVTWPWGFLNQVVRKDEPFDFDAYLKRSTQQIPQNLEAQVSHAVRPGSWEKTVLLDYWDLERRRSNRILTYGIERNEDPQVLHIAEGILSNLIQRHPSPPPVLYKNLGILYSHLTRTQPGARSQMIQAWTRFLQIAPNDDPDLPAIRKTLQTGP